MIYYADAQTNIYFSYKFLFAFFIHSLLFYFFLNLTNLNSYMTFHTFQYLHVVKEKYGPHNKLISHLTI